MKTWTTLFLLLPTAVAVFAAGDTTTSTNPMNSKNLKESVAVCKPGDEKSACGLPSRVVIDMSKSAVKHTDAEWQTLLTPEQFRVARKQGTERPFSNEF